jgi:hypothetical protein
VSPRIRLVIAIRLSWLCKLGFLGKRESTYTCLGMGEKHIEKTKRERETNFREKEHIHQVKSGHGFQEMMQSVQH